MGVQRKVGLGFIPVLLFCDIIIFVGTEVLLIILLVILNGIFSAGEMAMVSIERAKLKSLFREKNDKFSETLLKIKESPEKFLSSVQVGITLFGTLASALSGVIAAERIKPSLASKLGKLADPISIAIAVFLMTVFFLVFGELVPKSLGLSHKEKVVRVAVPLILFVSKALFFFVETLTYITNSILTTLRLKKSEDQISEAELRILIEEGRKKGVIDRTEEEIFHGVFRFAKKSVKEVMVPKPRVYSIDMNSSPKDVLAYIVENEYSRYPVYLNEKDNIVGVVYFKDIIRELHRSGSFEIEKVMKKPYFVPDTMEISQLFKEMQRRHIHMAIVVDEYGTTVGIVTLEDIMEEIFGEIMDETDEEENIERMKNGSYMIDASSTISDLNEKLKLDLPESPDYETLGGFILKKLGEIPKGGEVVTHGRFKFTVLKMEGRRISKVRVETLK